MDSVSSRDFNKDLKFYVDNMTCISVFYIFKEQCFHLSHYCLFIVLGGF